MDTANRTVIDEETKAMLVREALAARKNSYCPYSHFAVGAALLSDDGTVTRGANIENAAFGVTNCAERSAIFAAASRGERHFAAIAIVGAPEGQPATELCTPCGSCRQVMTEFAEPEEFLVLLGTEDGSYRELTLSELLPYSFGHELDKISK